MTVTETIKDTVKSAVGTSDEPRESQSVPSQLYQVVSNSDWALALNADGMSSSAIGRATREEMSEARLPLPYRDSCAHLLIPLNRCRFEEFYMPWKCVDERHSYEKCQYLEFKKRVAMMDEIRAAKGGARSN